MRIDRQPKPPAAQPPDPNQEPAWSVCLDAAASAGNMLAPLARLLLSLANGRRREGGEAETK